LNRKVECRTKQEYYQQNQNKKLARSEAIYQKNRQKCIERAIRNHANNSKRYKEQAKKHFQKKHKFQHHFCLICNRSLFGGTKARHERSKKHQNNLKLKLEEEDKQR
jgi:hypothetical protein